MQSNGSNLTVHRPINNNLAEVFKFRMPVHWRKLSAKAKAAAPCIFLRKNVLDNLYINIYFKKECSR